MTTAAFSLAAEASEILGDERFVPITGGRFAPMGDDGYPDFELALTEDELVEYALEALLFADEVAADPEAYTPETRAAWLR